MLRNEQKEIATSKIEVGDVVHSRVYSADYTIREIKDGKVYFQEDSNFIVDYPTELAKEFTYFERTGLYLDIIADDKVEDGTRPSLTFGDFMNVLDEKRRLLAIKDKQAKVNKLIEETEKACFKAIHNERRGEVADAIEINSAMANFKDLDDLIDDFEAEAINNGLRILNKERRPLDGGPLFVKLTWIKE